MLENILHEKTVKKMFWQEIYYPFLKETIAAAVVVVEDNYYLLRTI